VLDSPEGVCAGQVEFEYPATSVPFSKCSHSVQLTALLTRSSFTDTAPIIATSCSTPCLLHRALPAQTHSNILPRHPTYTLISTPAPTQPRTSHLSVVPLPSPRTIQIQHTTALHRRCLCWQVLWSSARRLRLDKHLPPSRFHPRTPRHRVDWATDSPVASLSPLGSVVRRRRRIRLQGSTVHILRIAANPPDP
jgi:hypothetical protein